MCSTFLDQLWMISENVESRKLFSLFAYPKFNQPYSSFFFFKCTWTRVFGPFCYSDDSDTLEPDSIRYTVSYHAQMYVFEPYYKNCIKPKWYLLSFIVRPMQKVVMWVKKKFRILIKLVVIWLTDVLVHAALAPRPHIC